MFTRKYCAVLTLSALLAACGGGGGADAGGGGGGGTTPTTPAEIALAGVKTQLASITDAFKTALPTDEALAPMFASNFAFNGIPSSVFIDEMQVAPETELDPSFVGASFEMPTVVNMIDDSTAEVKFTIKFAGSFKSVPVTMNFQKVGDKWVMLGNSKLAAVKVFTQTTLVEQALSTPEVLALPNLTNFVGTWEGQPYTYYQQALPSSAAVDFPGSESQTGWVGREGNAFDDWGKMIWVGDEYDAGWSTYNDRALRQKYTQNIALSSSKVNRVLVLEVDKTEVDPRVTKVVITGPGLPSVGLIQEKTLAGDFAFKGDLLNSNTFNSSRCANFGADAPADCALDWSAITDGSVYKFALFDVDGVKIGEETYTVPVAFPSEATLLANKDKYFGMFVTSAAGSSTTTPEPSIANIFNDVDGPFLPGKTVHFAFKAPSNAGTWLSSYEFNTQYCTGSVSCDGAHPLVEIKYEKNLYSASTALGAIVQNAGFTIPADSALIKWAFGTSIAFDANDNVYMHSISPKNPR